MRSPLCKRFLIAGILALLFIVLAMHAPILQPAGYHKLADGRTLLGLAHFWNVASNLPFLVVGILGMALMSRKPTGAVTAWRVFFLGTVLVFFGSSYYHLDPHDDSLIWDRVPMGVAFMAFFVALLAEHAGDERQGRLLTRFLLPPLALFSAGAVFWWRWSGDLAPWVWVQLAPILAIPLVIGLLPGKWSHRRYFFYALGFYAVAKLLELGDQAVMEWTAGLMSGHPLKHLAAAAGIACFFRMLQLRINT